MLEAEGISAAMYDMRFVKPLDETMLHEVFGKFDKVITVEDGCIQGGMGSAVLGVRRRPRLHRPAWTGSVSPTRCIEHGTQAELYTECGYNVDDIAATARKLAAAERTAMVRKRPAEPQVHLSRRSSDLRGMEDAIRNRVEESGLVQLDLAASMSRGTHVARHRHRPPACGRGWSIREQPYRAWLKDVGPRAVRRRGRGHCTARADAVVPEWAWMLVATALQGQCEQSVHLCAPESFGGRPYWHRLAEDHGPPAECRGPRVVVKGCGLAAGAGPAVRLVERLQPVVKSLMFGEPCSTVPVYKSR